jgi:hypothetical protein
MLKLMSFLIWNEPGEVRLVDFEPALAITSDRLKLRASGSPRFSGTGEERPKNVRAYRSAGSSVIDRITGTSV